MKEIFNKLKDFKDNDEKGKMIFFFGFYVLFFIFLFLLITTNRNPDYLLQEYENSKVDTTPLFNSDNIMKQNFMYDYKVTVDGVLYDYYGKRLNKVDSFKYNNLDYYRDDENTFVNQGTWIKTDNPVLFPEFFSEIHLYQIFKQASYESTVSYENGNNDYHLLLSSNTLFDIFYQKNTDYDEIPNEMIVSTDVDNNVTKIVFQLNSYCSVIENCNETLTIEVTYDLFGDIKKIDNPLE